LLPSLRPEDALPRVLWVREHAAATRAVRGEEIMTVEKAFAIRAIPDVIYAALERDLADAASDGGAFQVLHRDPPRSLQLRVTMSGVPCYLTYTLRPRDGDTEVSATLIPFGLKYTIFRIITLGLHDGGFSVALVHGLSNLKAAVEQAGDG
jgi:hypothetical protein